MGTLGTWVYMILGTCYRLAILTVYYRIFKVNYAARAAILIGAGAMLIINTIVLFVVIFNCSPPSEVWKIRSSRSNCRDARPWAYGAYTPNFTQPR